MTLIMAVGGWWRTSSSPTGSGPEGSSPNDFERGSIASLLFYHQTDGACRWWRDPDRQRADSGHASRPVPFCRVRRLCVSYVTARAKCVDVGVLQPAVGTAVATATKTANLIDRSFDQSAARRFGRDMAKKIKTSASSDDGADGSDGQTPAPASPYVVLARKYRPRSFDDLIGQSAMVTTLRNAFASGRIAQGYMLTGVRGVGKTTTARILARALNYETADVDKPTIDMPDLGQHCHDIMEGRHPDVFEIDAASNTGIDNIRDIIDSAQYTPLVTRTKVFIIDEVHMLSKGAFNALLKTLEEPPSHVRFIFATTEIRKVPVTVLSRCQRFDLRRVSQPELVRHFGKIVSLEGADADTDALALIARAAEGSVRDGLSILDQAIATAQSASQSRAASAVGSRITADAVRAMLGLADRGRIYDLAEALFRGDTAAALGGLEALYRDGAEASQIMTDLAEAVHVVARVKAVGEEPSGESLSAEEKRRAQTLASQLSMAYLSRAWQMLAKGVDETLRSPSPLAAAEMALIRLAYTADLPTPDDLIRTLSGATVATQRTSRPAPPSEVEVERGPLNARPASTQQTSPQPPPQLTQPPTLAPVAAAIIDDDASDSDFDELDGDGLALDDSDRPTAPTTLPFPAVPNQSVVERSARELQSFKDVVALVQSKRDAKLKLHLEDDVSLVKFDGTAGSIDVFLLPGAPPELANDLREKLNAWTGRRWMVVLSKQPGAPAIGAVRRAEEQAELESLKQHPAVQAVMAVFPDAKIAEIRRLASTSHDQPIGDDESRTG